MPRKCLKHPNICCYVWGEMTYQFQRRNFSLLIKKCFELYFGCKVRYQDKIWAPQHEKYNWKILEDLKAFVLILDLQLGYTKFCCFLREWGSRYRKHYYIQKHCPKRESLIPGQKNVTNIPLTNPENVYLPPLHIILGLIKISSRRGSK